MKRKNSHFYSNQGITLIALIVTIIVLIILATISINVVLGENGIIKKAERAKVLHSNAVVAEEGSMDTLVDEYEKLIVGGNYTDKYIDSVLPVAPRLATGMTKVKYNSDGKWEKVTDDGAAWYNYANKEWANVVLSAETDGSSIFKEDGTLDESKNYVQLVWIPRYAYQITSQYHTAGSTAGNISVVFIGTDNKGKDGTEYSTTYPNATDGGGMDDYVVHPAFDYGGTHLAGFWMGKFESSHTDCTTDVTTGQAAYTGNEVMTVKANVTSWRKLTIGEAFTTCLAMNRVGNPYGLNSSDSIVDPHMVKNTEWGAVAYLSKSSYGKETEEVYINNSSDFITGNAGETADAEASAGVTNAYNTDGGVKASTTGNVYGIYDMSGGNWERVAAYVANGHENLRLYGSELINGATKYKNEYAAEKQWTSESPDTATGSYALATPTNGHYGDAVYETSSKSESPWLDSWYSDFSHFPELNGPFFARSGGFSGTTKYRYILFCNDYWKLCYWMAVSVWLYRYFKSE